jgi:hypothetical protein
VQFLALWLSYILRNPAEMAALMAILQSLPGLNDEVKTDVAVVAELGQVWARKQPGTIQFAPADGSPVIPIHAVTF